MTRTRKVRIGSYASPATPAQVKLYDASVAGVAASGGGSGGSGGGTSGGGYASNWWNPPFGVPDGRWTPLDLWATYGTPSSNNFTYISPTAAVTALGLSPSLLITPAQLVADGKLAANVTDLNTILAAVANYSGYDGTNRLILALDANKTYTWSGFGYASGYAGVLIDPRSGQIGHKGVRGIVGSGWSTVLQPKAMTSAATAGGAGLNNLYGASNTNQSYLIRFNHMNDGNGPQFPVFANLQFAGSPQQHFYNGVAFFYSYSPLISGVYFNAPSAGFQGSPPGETFSVNQYATPDLTLLDCDHNGSNAAMASQMNSLLGGGLSYSDGLRVSASPFGGNQTTGTTIKRFYCHHGYVSAPTWDHVYGYIHTEDLWSYSTAARYAGGNAAINHEHVNGNIVHTRPNCQIAGALSAPPGLYSQSVRTATVMDGHICFASGTASGAGDGDMPDITIIDPIWDRVGTWGMAANSSLFVVDMGGGTYDLSVWTTPPNVYIAGTKLTVKRHSAGGYTSSNPLTTCLWHDIV